MLKTYIIRQHNNNMKKVENDFITSPVTLNIQITPDIYLEKLRGNTDQDRIDIILASHESIEEIYSTIEHELLHHAISVNIGDLEGEDFSEITDHRIIQHIMWVNEYI